jgi:hypothetical protein
MKLTRPAVLLGAVPALALALAPSAALASHGHHRGHDVIRADLTPSLPTDDPINLVAPGGAPWQIDRGEVRVRPNGRMDVRIEGLKVSRPDGSSDNPVPMVDAVLYCGGRLTADSGPQQLTVPDGDAEFRVRLGSLSGCSDASVLISPSTAVGHLFIASAVD